MENYIGIALSVGTLLVSGIVAYMVKSAKADMNELRVEIAEARLQDTLQMRAWINGSFMRAADVRAEVVEMSRVAEIARKDLEHRVETLEAERRGQD